MTLLQFIAKWAGKKADFDGHFQGQCVDLFRFYVKEVLNIPQPKSVNGAADFWTNYSTDPALNTKFTKVANTPDFKPKAGDVMIWTRRAGGGFGHIGVVANNNATLDKFTSFDQNWRALNVCELTEHNYTNVYGVLRPLSSTQESMPEDSISVSKKTFEQLVTKSTAYDKFVEAGVELDTVMELKKELEGKNAVISAKDEKWTKFVERVAGILGCPADGDNIIDFATRFSGEVDSALKYKDMCEREVQARKADYEASQSQLAKYDEAIHELRDDFTKEQEILEAKWMKKLDNLQAQVEKALARAKVAEDALQAHTKFAGFWKLLGKIKKG